MQYSTITIEKQGSIAILRLARPDKMNAFTVTMADELEHFFNNASTDDTIRVIIVTAVGRAFCAGMDLSVEGNVFGLDNSQNPKKLSEYKKVQDTGGRVALSIYNCNKVVIAAVQGVAVGIGSTMLLPMDFRLCSSEAKFGFVFSRLGIVNEACSSFFLPKLVGIAQANEWLIRGHIFDAQEALTGGLVRQICTPESLLEQSLSLAKEIIDNTSAVSVTLIRQMLYRELGSSSPFNAHRLESLGVFHTSLKDGAEGVKAFKEKRKPNFQSGINKNLPPYYPWWQEEH